MKCKHVTFQKSAFTLFITLLNIAARFWYIPCWFLKRVRINIPVGCTDVMTLPLAISVVVFNPWLDLP